MRTKTLLLAVAALATGMISSEAQNVYSANIVGYVNVVVPASPGWACVANPLDLDGVDNITNVLANAPKGTLCEFWSGAGFPLVVKRSTVGAGAWGANATNVYIPPGVGFMMQCPSIYTNTFVGNVIIAPGATNTLTVNSGYQLVGSPIPYSGTLTNASDNGTNTLNLGASMPKGTIINVWNNGFAIAAKRSTVGAGNWTANPSFTAGEGFFLTPPTGTNWQQTLSSQ
jgi:hypothetical protein